MKQKLKDNLFSFLKRLSLRMKPMIRRLHIWHPICGNWIGHILEELLKADDCFLKWNPQQCIPEWHSRATLAAWDLNNFQMLSGMNFNERSEVFEVLLVIFSDNAFSSNTSLLRLSVMINIASSDNALCVCSLYSCYCGYKRDEMGGYLCFMLLSEGNTCKQDLK